MLITLQEKFRVKKQEKKITGPVHARVKQNHNAHVQIKTARANNLKPISMSVAEDS